MDKDSKPTIDFGPAVLPEKLIRSLIKEYEIDKPAPENTDAPSCPQCLGDAVIKVVVAGKEFSRNRPTQALHNHCLECDHIF